MRYRRYSRPLAGVAIDDKRLTLDRDLAPIEPNKDLAGDLDGDIETDRGGVVIRAVETLMTDPARE